MAARQNNARPTADEAVAPVSLDKAEQRSDRAATDEPSAATRPASGPAPGRPTGARPAPRAKSRKQATE